MKLYELTNDLRQLEAMVESGDISKDEIADTLEAVNMEFDDKVKNCCMVIKNNDGYIDSIQKEIDRLVSMQKHYKLANESITDYIKLNMINLDKDKVDAGLFKLTLRKSTQKLGDLDESKIPEKYFTVVPATKKLDRRLLLKDAKQSSIDGVELAYSERSLSIK